MRAALIGYTGFVGGNLARQHTFDDVYRSLDIERIRGRGYDLVVCAGAPGVKWLANREPDKDRASIERLCASLRELACDAFVLISTVDVYPVPRGVDETTAIDASQATPYGRHRRQLEQFVHDHFAATTLRLPGLFGPGLRKNVIYDLLHDHETERIHAESVFQLYDLTELWTDIEMARARGLSLLNVATEPLSVREIAREAFGIVFDNVPAGIPARYDMRSVHAAVFGGVGDYLRDRSSVLASLGRFVRAERARLR